MRETVVGRVVDVSSGKSREEFGFGVYGKEGGRGARKGLSWTRWSSLLER